MFNKNDWHIARLNYSDFYKKAYYNTNLNISLVNEELGERLSMGDTTHTRREDTPNVRLYMDTPIEELPQYAFINLNPTWKMSRRMNEEQYTQACSAKPSKKASQSIQADA